MNRRDYSGSGNPNYGGGYDTKCHQCGRKVHVKPSQAKRERFFCSKPCAHAWASANIRADNHWRFQGGTVAKVCQHCQKSFQQRLAEHNRKGRTTGLFCSRFCMGANWQLRLLRQIFVCKYCMCGFHIKKNKDAAYCSCRCKKLGQIKDRTEKEIACIKLGKRMASLMCMSLRGKKKGRRWEDLTGYSVHDLMAHLESQFQEGMTWENIGEWHVDHIQPRASFLYTSPEDDEFLACWAMSNLQPLWAVDNLRKGSKLNYKVG